METQTTIPCMKCGSTERLKSGDCAPCNRIRCLTYRNTHLPEQSARSKKWRDANPERVKARLKKWVAEHPERVKEQTTRWQAAHPLIVKAMAKRYRVENPDKVKAGRLRYTAANSEKVKAAHAKWKAANPEKRRASKHKRRAKEKKSGGFFTTEDIRAMLKRQRGRCVVCHTTILKSYQIDHIMPIALGGSNNISNIQLLCKGCNLSKCAKHPIDFMQSRGFLL